MDTNPGEKFESREAGAKLEAVQSPDQEAERLGLGSLDSALEQASDLVNRVVRDGEVISIETVENEGMNIQQLETLAKFLQSNQNKQYQQLGRELQMNVVPQVYRAASEILQRDKTDDERASEGRVAELRATLGQEPKIVSGGDDSWIEKGTMEAEGARMQIDASRDQDAARIMPAPQPKPKGLLSRLNIFNRRK
ncbi:hypothetical protein COT97_04915 [Candidatus Falkowbacteria bacterium CG10_big_fil_rev_8_21_14_0_10_39_11]|uniref:Uncharacterized protein n=1 Tax=Candidatus Falkowbacteria bacterium CG10_big_fil_rev_8_21_14_0_10_39_11 TaxID=1974565 RepID=A0A2H0V3V3_9BACT|nr:MAG: hypothetical protein COT97_04915 [Candidatus Falkowbacteria bacterium CG10_big_fil_rev_8_21_14_0_10_39_11]